MNNRLTLQALSIQKMECGRRYLTLSENISWECFQQFACQLTDMLEGKVIRKFDGVDMRMLEVDIKGCTFRVVFDDFPVMVTLESTDSRSDLLIPELFQKLQESST